MKNNFDTKQNNNLKSKAIILISKAIAKIILKFRMPRVEFIRALDEQLVLEAQKTDPKASIVAIAIRTGIDRRYVSKYINGQMPHTKPNKLSIIMSDVIWTSKKFYNGNIIPKKGPFRTFQSICQERASGTLTYKSILKELIALGNLKDLGNKIEVINSLYSISKDEEQYGNITALQINRTVNTIVHNFDQTESYHKHIQRTIYSTQVNPKRIPELHQELIKITNNFREEIDVKITSYEEEVKVGTYPQYGISFFEFKLEE